MRERIIKLIVLALYRDIRKLSPKYRQEVDKKSTRISSTASPKKVTFIFFLFFPVKVFIWIIDRSYWLVIFFASSRKIWPTDVNSTPWVSRRNKWVPREGANKSGIWPLLIPHHSIWIYCRNNFQKILIYGTTFPLFVGISGLLPDFRYTSGISQHLIDSNQIGQCK